MQPIAPTLIRWLTSGGFCFNPASTASRSEILTRASRDVLDAIFIGLYRRLANTALRDRGFFRFLVPAHDPRYNSPNRQP
jgi:hypothetical protein